VPAYWPPFPLVDKYPVVRIPVAGPDPFNTLVVVRCRVTQSVSNTSDGHFRHLGVGFETPFVLANYRAGAQYKHSTTGVLQNLQLSDDTSFLESLDAVLDASFDETGRWVVSADVAGAVDHEDAVVGIYISSWVLCVEPR
jgi:hypothetical protein